MRSLRGWRTALLSVALSVVLAGVLVGCGEPDEPTPEESQAELLVNDGVSCDQNVSSDEAKDIIERVGGLQQPTWSVRFAESTAAGVVVLVSGDLEEAGPALFDDYHVAAIVGTSEDQTRVEDFRAVRDAVREICG